MNVTVLNSVGELSSFPLTQVIKIKFEKPVEDSQLKACISLIRNVNQTGLFNISETYNQSIGYIREKFDVEDIILTTETVDSSFIVSVKPVKPLSPGFEYTLFIDKSLSLEYVSIAKPISKSSSTVKVDVSTTLPFDISLEIISEPLITSTTNLIKVLLKDVAKGTSKQITLDLKNKNYTKYEDVTIRFESVIYALGEVFTILSVGYEPLIENLFVNLKTSLTENVKPITPDSTFTSLSNEDLIKFFNKEEDKKIENKKELISNNKLRITLGGDITTDDLDFTGISYKSSEAFGMYTLTSLELYDETKEYVIEHEIVDSKTFYLVVKEMV